jgi:hypothetical protein
VFNLKRGGFMSGERGISITNQTDLATNWNRNLAVADQMVKTGFLPKTIRTAQQAVMIMETGRELGIPPIESLRNIYIVDMKPALASQLMLSLLYRSGKIEDIKIEDNEKYCKVTMKRMGMSPYTVVWTEEDSRKAGLLYKDNWRKFPKSMYRARAISLCARAVAPDVIAGLYTPEELEAGLDTEETLTQIEKSSELTDTEKYNNFIDETMKNIREELPKMTEPSQVEMFKRAMENDLKMMIEADKLVAEGEINARFNELITGNLPPKSKIEEYKALAEQNQTSEDLINWYKSVRENLIKDLSSEELQEFSKFCKSLKEKLEIGLKELEPPEPIKEEPTKEEILTKFGGEELPVQDLTLICESCSTIIDKQIEAYSKAHFVMKDDVPTFVKFAQKDDERLILCRTCQNLAKEGRL